MYDASSFVYDEVGTEPLSMVYDRSIYRRSLEYHAVETRVSCRGYWLQACIYALFFGYKRGIDRPML